MDVNPKCSLGAFSLVVLVLISRSIVHGADEIKTNADFQQYKILNYGEALILQCNVTNPSSDLVMSWLKNGKPLKSDGGQRPKVTISKKDIEHTLRVSNAMQEDVANYTCQLVNSKNNQSAIAKFDFEIVGKPFVKLPETITVIEEEKLKLECIVLGSHSLSVEWIVGNKSYEESEGRVKLSTDPVKNIKNAIMELEPAQMSDRGDVTCIGNNIATTQLLSEPNKATVYVRVKDKYAALWPFLGICAEVIVLCAVIFIYEKKRNKTELEESDTDQSPEQKNTPDHGKDSVRQRK